MIQTRLKAYKLLLLLILLSLTGIFYLIHSPAPEQEKPVERQIEPTEPILTMQATAFTAYGWDANGIDYGPGYVIVSSKAGIPLYTLLDIDVYGEGQVLSLSDELAPDEIRVWYNSPSKVPMFGQQTAKVKVKGEGDKL